MTSHAKRWHVGATIDRISNLPRNLIDHIVESLPVRDAARTSVLSKTWKNIWENHPLLVFDEKFLSQLAPGQGIEAKLLTFTKTISDILLLHSGPIVKFHIFIHEYLPLYQCRDLDIWIKNISNNGVRKLELFNDLQVAYKLSSNLYSCLELTDLTLNSCILHPPPRFGGFCNLKRAKLIDVTVTADMSLGDQIEELVFEQCTGLKHLGCHFRWNNTLTTLKIIDCGEINLQWFEYTKNVQNFGLMLEYVTNHVPGSVEKFFRFMSFDKLVGIMPKIYCLQLNSISLNLLRPVAANLKMESLKSLHLCRITLEILKDLENILCLIKTLPNLQYLHIQLESKWVWTFGKEYMQSQYLCGLILDQLETVKIAGMMHNESGLYLIQLLLASSPSLKWMRLVSDSMIDDPKEVYRISRELMRFPRASSAQIIWTYCI